MDYQPRRNLRGGAYQVGQEINLEDIDTFLQKMDEFNGEMQDMPSTSLESLEQFEQPVMDVIKPQIDIEQPYVANEQDVLSLAREAIEAGVQTWVIWLAIIFGIMFVGALYTCYKYKVQKRRLKNPDYTRNI